MPSYCAVMRSLYLKSLRANLALRYGLMYQSLGLTQAQIDKFEELAITQADDVITMQAAALAQGLTLSDPGLAALEKQNVDQFYATIASAVGAAVSQQVIQLDRMQGMQDIVNGVDNMITAGSPPLTSLQGAQLTQILANASASYKDGGNADQNTINWDNVYDQAEALLSGPQFQAFKAEAGSLRLRPMFEQFYSQQQAGSP
jgi:hypothetical protein